MRTKSPRRREFLLALLLVGVGLVGGCGYRTSSRTAKDIKSIYVPFFENQTSQPSLEITVTEQIINDLISDNTLKVVRENEADAVLDGKIVEFRNQPFSFNPGNLSAQQYVVVIRVVATLFNRRTNEAIWKDRSFQGNGNYFVESTANGQTFEQAVSQCIDQITQQILNLTTQDW